MADGEPRVITIGHSTRSLGEFLDLLRVAGVSVLVDVRIAPGSRRHPQFGKDALAAALAAAGIRYVHAPDLGGRRQGRADSPHVGWRNASFRAYADHMESPAFQEAIASVIATARSQTVALMCAEAVPWRCHRQLIADALVAHGLEVVHVIGPGESRPHALTPFARLEDGRIIYDRTDGLFDGYRASSSGRGRPRNPSPR